MNGRAPTLPHGYENHVPKSWDDFSGMIWYYDTWMEGCFRWTSATLSGATYQKSAVKCLGPAPSCNSTKNFGFWKKKASETPCIFKFIGALVKTLNLFHHRQPGPILNPPTPPQKKNSSSLVLRTKVTTHRSQPGAHINRIANARLAHVCHGDTVDGSCLPFHMTNLLMIQNFDKFRLSEVMGV